MRGRRLSVLAVLAWLGASCGLLAPLDPVNRDSGPNTAGSNDGAPVGVPVRNGLTLWLDAQAPGEAGPALARWRNLAEGGESDATQSSVDERPELTTASGRRGALFEGSDFMDFAPGFSNYSAGITIFAVASFDQPEICAPLFQAYVTKEVHDISFQSDGYPEPNTLTLEIWETTTKGLGVLPAGLVVLLAGYVTPAGGGAVNVNGQFVGTGVEDAARVPYRTDRVAHLGKGEYDDCTTFHGVMYELLLYERSLAVESEFAEVVDYLQTKWNCCGN